MRKVSASTITINNRDHFLILILKNITKILVFRVAAYTEVRLCVTQQRQPFHTITTTSQVWLAAYLQLKHVYNESGRGSVTLDPS